MTHLEQFTESGFQVFRDVIDAAGIDSLIAMRPLLLHASHSADAPSHRRVIHVEFAAEKLPIGLEWAER